MYTHSMYLMREYVYCVDENQNLILEKDNVIAKLNEKQIITG